MWEEIEKKSKHLDDAIQQLATNGIDLANKEKEYKIALNKKALELRAEDMPVTLINQVIYGYDDIALLRLARDTAQVKYNANLEYINTIKLQIRILENQMQREWGNTK
jgi:hypothetical protein